MDTEIAFLLSIVPVFDESITKFKREEQIIHLSYANYEKLLKATVASLMKSKVHIKKEGKAFKEVNVEDVNLQLNGDWFKAVQEKGEEEEALTESQRAESIQFFSAL